MKASSRVSTANQRLQSAISVQVNGREYKTLPRGAIVKFIAKQYVPTHVLEKIGAEDYDESRQVAVFSQFGIVFVDPDLLDWCV